MQNVRLTETVTKAAGAMQRDQNGADIPDKPLFVKTLGIVDAYPVGCPIPYPGATAPDGYLAMDGRAFDKTLYPQLAKFYTDGKLPDMRGMFVRGFDFGRGVDSLKIYKSPGDLYVPNKSWAPPRLLLSEQYFTNNLILKGINYKPIKGRVVDEYKTGGFSAWEGGYYVPTANGVDTYRKAVTRDTPDHLIESDTRDEVLFGPPNIAFNYITKAA